MDWDTPTLTNGKSDVRRTSPQTAHIFIVVRSLRSVIPSWTVSHDNGGQKVGDVGRTALSDPREHIDTTPFVGENKARR